jgi:putative Holliday junction resolvase
MPEEQVRGEKNDRRIIALDVGTVRIGVAASDPLGSFAQGVAVLSATGRWMEDLSSIMVEYGASAILVGMPRRTDGAEGPEVSQMRRVIESLTERFAGVEIIEWDERFTTTLANQALLEADVSRKGRRSHVDKVAATLLLQSYLDSRSGDSRQAPQILPRLDDARDSRRKERKRKNQYD